jgi:diaminobutyrate-2-oxoglutarate transaminase
MDTVNHDTATDLEIFASVESNVRSYIRAFPTVFTTATGSTMVDEDGREYLDFFAGAGTLNYGHNNPRFKERIVDYIQSDAITHSLDMATVAKRDFLTAFQTHILEPRGLSYRLQFTGPTGANAVEAALKVVRQATGRTNIIAFTHAFHGVSEGALAATANVQFRQAAAHPLGNVSFMPYDGYLGADVDTLDYLERVLNDPSSGIDKPAAVIVETVQGEGGINVARTEWLRRLDEITHAAGALLIVDDIQVGCGRTGGFFSFEEAGIHPDVVTLSKSLSGYGLPMSLTLIKPEVDVWSPAGHTGTFRGNNLAFVGAVAAIENYWQDDLLSRDVERKGEFLRGRLSEIASSHPEFEFSVRGRGLVNGFASTKDLEFAGAIARKAFERGLIIETSGAFDEVLKFLPALTIEDEELSRGLDIVEASVAAVAAER